MKTLPPPPFVPEGEIRRLGLEVSRRLDGLLQGDHVRAQLGPGSEPAEARLYVVGDDSRRIDWAATARTGETHVRSTSADRELETTLVVDLTPSMAFGTRRSEKRDLALAVAPTFATLAYEWTSGVAPSNAIRFAAGLPIGVAGAWLVLAATSDQVN